MPKNLVDLRSRRIYNCIFASSHTRTSTIQLSGKQAGEGTVQQTKEYNIFIFTLEYSPVIVNVPLSTSTMCELSLDCAGKLNSSPEFDFFNHTKYKWSFCIMYSHRCAPTHSHIIGDRLRHRYRAVAVSGNKSHIAWADLGRGRINTIYSSLLTMDFICTNIENLKSHSAHQIACIYSHPLTHTHMPSLTLRRDETKLGIETRKEWKKRRINWKGHREKRMRKKRKMKSRATDTKLHHIQTHRCVVTFRAASWYWIHSHDLVYTATGNGAFERKEIHGKIIIIRLQNIFIPLARISERRDDWKPCMRLGFCIHTMPNAVHTA